MSPGRFWHITDLHLDPTYHLAPDPTKVCYSSKGVPTINAGLYGDFLCDSPYRLIQSAFTNMATLTQPQDFIIWTGSVLSFRKGFSCCLNRKTSQILNKVCAMIMISNLTA